MSFIVSASANTPKSTTGSARDLSYRHHSMLGALEQGLALLSCGMENVRITDIHGRRRTPAEFSRVVFEGRDAAASDTRSPARLAWA